LDFSSARSAFWSCRPAGASLGECPSPPERNRPPRSVARCRWKSLPHFQTARPNCPSRCLIGLLKPTCDGSRRAKAIRGADTSADSELRALAPSNRKAVAGYRACFSKRAAETRVRHVAQYRRLRSPADSASRRRRVGEKGRKHVHVGAVSVRRCARGDSRAHRPRTSGRRLVERFHRVDGSFDAPLLVRAANYPQDCTHLNRSLTFVLVHRFN